MTLHPRKRDRVVTTQVTQGWVGTGLQQHPTDIQVTTHRRQHEGRTSLGVATVNRRAASEMEFHGGRNTRGQGQPEQRPEARRRAQAAFPARMVHVT